MCGIAGIIDFKREHNEESLTALVEQMADALTHRGPDDGGTWCDMPHGIALAHRRLSIIDLSEHGHQPMESACGRYRLTYNGEIYNFRELRAQLAYPWQGESDTEVLLAALVSWGVESTVKALNGMFAFALWDREAGRLWLARDRVGEKPLYYGHHHGAFVFASEMAAFFTLPDFSPSIRRDALSQYMRYGYIGSPLSIYDSIEKLEPGHVAWVNLEQGQLEKKPYWSIEAVAQAGQHIPFDLSAEEALEELEAILEQAVGLRMVADVPLGAFLSGGIDSSLIVALMQQQSRQPVRTFSIGFDRDGFDEAPYAKAIARHLRTDHTELYVTAEECKAVIPLIPQLYSEPFADSSQIPTFLVAKMAREHVTVALTGDGGDEFFGGYNRYIYGRKLWAMMRLWPPFLRRNVARHFVEKSAAAVEHFKGTSSFWAYKMRKVADKLQARDPKAFYDLLCASLPNADTLVIDGSVPPGRAEQNQLGLDFTQWMMVSDTLQYLPEDVLTKVDRAAMAVSLETRLPFLDPDVMTYAWQLPLNYKIRGQQGKWLLRQLLYRHVPAEYIDRPKAGFAMPIGQWLREELQEWAGDLLSPALLKRQGYLHEPRVTQLWKEHRDGTRDHNIILWQVLMFQSWLARHQEKQDHDAVAA